MGLACLPHLADHSPGFLTLLTSSIGPVHDFGVYAAVGVGVAYVWPSPCCRCHGARPPLWCPNKAQVSSGMAPCTVPALDAPQATLAIAWVGIAGTTTFLGSNLRVDNKLIEDLREDDPFRKQFAFFEREFAGVRPL